MRSLGPAAGLPSMTSSTPLAVDLAIGRANGMLDAVPSPLLCALCDAQGLLLSVKDAASGRYLLVNAAMARFLGRQPEAIVGATDAEWFDGHLSAALRAAEQTALGQAGAAAAAEHRFEWHGARHDFSVLRVAGDADALGRRLLCSLWADRSAGQQREGQLRAALEQLEQAQRANAALRRELADQALRDGPTGLYTRAHFEDQLRREADLSAREHREFALVFVSIDEPGETVRALGEPALSRIHEAMGRLLRGGTRAMDASCRYDERRFVVLLSGVGLATAHARMEGLRRQCATQIVLLDGRELGFTVSMGVASFPHTAQTIDELLAACSVALGEAQRRGGNHVALASIRLDRE